MSERLPVLIDVLKLAHQGRELAGSINLSNMPRLGQMLSSLEGTVDVKISLGIAPDGIPYLQGSASTSVEMICQRCLEPFVHDVDVSFKLGLIHSEKQADELPEMYDPMVVTEEPMSIASIVEDELIISLPQVAMHDESECPAAELLAQQTQVEESEKRESPFAVLRKLKSH